MTGTKSANHLSKNIESASGAAIENFSDILADAKDLRGVCELSLQYALETTGHSAGLLVAQTAQDAEPVCFARANISQDWVLQFSDSASPLRQLVTELIQNGHYLTGDTASARDGIRRLAAAIPVAGSSRVQAVLLVQGEECSPVEVDWLLKLARPMSRAIRMSRTLHAIPAAGVDGAPPGNWGQAGNAQVILDALLENTPGYLYIINRQYELVAMNGSVARRAGQSPNDLNGRLCYQALYQRTSPCSGCLVEDTLRKGKSTLRTAYRSPRQDTDAVLTYEIHSFPIYDFSAQIMQAILMEQDITDRRELEAVVAQSGKLAALGQLAAGVAHEINNPLTAIIANAQILQRELPPGDERLESVELIAMAGARAAQVVRNLLDFARKEQSQRVLTDINDTLRASLALVQHELVSRSVSLHFRPDDGLPMILAAPDSLQGVWLNLLLNAIEAIDKQTGVVQVISRHEEDNVVVIISDNGRGIPADRLERIFEPFYTTKGPGRGTGLGLSVCRRIVEQHGGLISVESQLGLGTEFKVVFRVP